MTSVYGEWKHTPGKDIVLEGDNLCLGCWWGLEPVRTGVCKYWSDSHLVSSKRINRGPLARRRGKGVLPLLCEVLTIWSVFFLCWAMVRLVILVGSCEDTKKLRNRHTDKRNSCIFFSKFLKLTSIKTSSVRYSRTSSDIPHYICWTIPTDLIASHDHDPGRCSATFIREENGAHHTSNFLARIS